jgi:hypothetical protein
MKSNVRTTNSIHHKSAKKYSRKQILYELDLLKVIKELPNVKEILEKITKEVLIQRKETLEEILKAEALDYNRDKSWTAFYYQAVTLD